MIWTAEWKYAFGTLLAHDQSPGEAYDFGDPYGSDANFAVVSVRRDVLRQSSVRLFATDREYRDTYNRVAESWNQPGYAYN